MPSPGRAELVDEDDVAASIVCGPDQDGFFDFYEREVLPGLG
ncbi:MAG TPA: hypothetical protein VEW07_05495 [Solirubrobacterales bacterium]|nr:hypothetical protein [Solirubrobacterales bacterium]